VHRDHVEKRFKFLLIERFLVIGERSMPAQTQSWRQPSLDQETRILIGNDIDARCGRDTFPQLLKRRLVQQWLLCL
jgi:hypothetical protein